VKQHYVPAFYLRSFADPGCPPDYEPYLWVVDLDDGKIRRRSPAKTALLTDYYVISDKKTAMQSKNTSPLSKTKPLRSSAGF